MEPFRIKFIPQIAVTLEKHKANVEANKGRDRVRFTEVKDVPLAIVGGGPSVLENLEELRNWPGEIWAVNWTCEWLSSIGIRSKLVTVDSSIKSLPRAELCTGAVLASCVDPDVFAQYDDAVCFDLIEDSPCGVAGGTTTACRIPIVCLQLGFTDIHYFGCEGSFTDQTHAYRHEEQFPNLLKVEAAGKVYTTRDDMLMQCEVLADIIKEFPNNLKNRSGGLLQGMIEDDQWKVVAVSESLRDQLMTNPVQTAIYDTPYVEPVH